MTEQQEEPSMEEILSSIRRILSTEEGVKTVGEKIPSDAIEQVVSQPIDEDVMDLTPEMLCENEQKAPQAEPEYHHDMELLSEETVQASADQLNNLTAHLIHNRGHEHSEKNPKTSVADGALEELVSALLRPYLKDWLDAHLPSVVEKIVKKEVERLTNKVG